MPAPTPNVITLSATGQYQLTTAGAGAGPAGWLLVFQGASWTGSGVLQSNQAPPGSATSLISVAWTNTSGVIQPAGTAITTSLGAIVEVTGYDLWIDYTHTAGAVTITVLPCQNVQQTGGLTVPAGDVSSGTFGAFLGPDTGSYTFPSALVVTTDLTAATMGFTTSLTSAAGKIRLGTAPPSDAAINVDGATAAYGGLFGHLVNGTGESVWRQTASGFAIFGTTSANALQLWANAEVKWQILADGGGTASLASGQATMRIIGGLTANQIRDAANANTNASWTDAGEWTFRSNVYSLSSIMAGATSALGFTGSSTIFAPSDGVLTLLNSNATDFNRLQFGGTDVLHPALKRAGTGIECRRADDSTFAPFTASAYSAGASAGVTAGPFTVITSITIVGGIVTALTGS